MKILIINTDYPAFLRQLYARHEHLAQVSYQNQMSVRNKSFFGVFDAYSYGFQKNGHEAIEIHANNGLMQRCWALEAGLKPRREWKLPARLDFLVRRIAHRVLPLPFDTAHVLRSPFDIAPWRLVDILISQVKAFEPDVILNQSVSEVGSDILEILRKHTKLIVGQIASPLPEDEDYRAYDFMVSSLPNFVEYFKKRGIPAYLNRLAFDARVLDGVEAVSRDVPVSFVGSLSPAHPARAALIEALAAQTKLDIWGNGLEQFPAESAVHRHYHGEVWGQDMFRALARSQITINNHIGIAENYANNMRLYEATGMGCMLLTDKKSNIHEIFEPGKEVVCYETKEECLDYIKYYSKNDQERAVIAAAGKERTLKEHTYLNKTKEITALFEQHLK